MLVPQPKHTFRNSTLENGNTLRMYKMLKDRKKIGKIEKIESEGKKKKFEIGKQCFFPSLHPLQPS